METPKKVKPWWEDPWLWSVTKTIVFCSKCNWFLFWSEKTLARMALIAVPLIPGKQFGWFLKMDSFCQKPFRTFPRKTRCGRLKVFDKFHFEISFFSPGSNSAEQVVMIWRSLCGERSHTGLFSDRASVSLQCRDPFQHERSGGRWFTCARSPNAAAPPACGDVAIHCCCASSRQLELALTPDRGCALEWQRGD